MNCGIPNAAELDATCTPAANFAGTDIFTYSVNDGQADSTAATVTIAVAPGNDAPVALADSVFTDEDAPVTTNVLANDSDVEKDLLRPSIVTGPSHGSAVVNAIGTVTYAPDPNYFGPDSFTYRVNDGQAD